MKIPVKIGHIPADDEIGDFFDQWKKAQNY